MSMPLTQYLHSVAWARAENHERQLLSALKAAHEAGKRKKADFLCAKYLRSHDARLVATVRAFKKLKKHRRPSVNALRDIAAGLNAWTGTDEEVILHFKERDSDDPYDVYRPVFDFGIENRSLQYLVMQPLRVTSRLASNQYHMNGGAPEALRAVATALLSGHTWIIQIDVNRCFDSINDKALPSLLHLDEEVIAHTITSNHTHIQLGNFNPFDPADDISVLPDFYADEVAAARAGLPQGSAASPLVADIVLASVLAGLPKVGTVVNYVDNFLVMTKSEDEAVSIAKALMSALEAHPAGPLRSRVVGRSTPGQPFEFLGRRVVLNKHGYCLVEPTEENLQEFRVKFRRLLKRETACGLASADRRKRLAKLRNYVRCWSAAFGMWDLAEQHRDYYLKQIPT